MSNQDSEVSKAPIFNPFSPDFLRDPYPAFHKLRATAPVHKTELGFWVASRYEDVIEILRNKNFGKGFEARTEQNHGPEIWKEPVYSSMRHWMLFKDPPDHGRLRGLVARAFSPRRLKELRPRIQQLVNRNLDGIEKKGKMDFIRDFAHPLPVHVICDMLGIPEDERQQFFKGSRIAGRLIDPTPINSAELKEINAGHLEQVTYFKTLFSRRRREPGDDITSELLQAVDTKNQLSEDELIANIILLFGAGHETTVNLLGNGLLGILSNRGEWEKLKSNGSLITSAVEEMLRFDSSVQMTGRVAVEDVEIGGVTVPAGEPIISLLGAANRDPERYEGADDFKVGREDIRPTSFGGGIHHCIGAPLARIEAEIAFATLIKRLPNLRLAESENFDWRMTFTLRGLTSLPVIW